MAVAEKKTVFRDPVFVRSDETTDIRASVVEWGGSLNGFSVRFVNDGGTTILINAEDWASIKSCIDCELNRVGAFDEVSA